MESRPALLLFDPYSAGHHAEYMRHVVEAWTDSGERLHVVASSSLLGAEPRLPNRAGVTYEALAEGPTWERDAATDLLRVGLRQGRAFAEVLKRHQPRRALAMYADHVLPSLALRMRVPPSTRVSGILFRPSFHYASAKASIETRVRELRKRATLWAALGHPQWATLFSLDPTAVGPIQALKPGAKVVALPDPVAQAARPEDREGAHAREALRAQLGVPEGRLMLLLFGVLDERKGLAEVSRALTMLRPDTARQLAVVFAGPIASRLEAQVTGWAEAARANGAVVVMRNRFMHEPEIRALLHASDGLLLCYQGHIGSSAVLIRAAGAGLPVIGATFGLLGAHIRRHRLGQAVESTDPVAIAGALDVFARTPRAGFDPEAAQRFAEANTVDGYVHTLLKHTLGQRSRSIAANRID